MRRMCVVSVVVLAAGAAVGQTTFTEAEPNNTKAAATPVLGMGPGDLIAGSSTGSSTTATGIGTADYFLVRTAPMPLGIYRHRLVSNSTANFPTTIRGLTTTNCVPNAGSDSTQQNAASNTTPPRMVQWYGFGREEQLYFRVTGTSTTTQPYGWTLARDLIQPVQLPVTVAPGSVTIERAPASTTDLDLAIYDEQLRPVAGYSNGGNNALTRDFAAGVYYIAVSRRSFANDQPCPADDTNRIAGAMDFPDVVVAFSNIVPTDVSLRVTHPGGVQDVPLSAPGAFEVVWVRFTVGTAVACGPQDFNGDGDSGTDQDIEAFFACLGGNCCPTCWPGGADFNGDGDIGTDQDIESFFRVLGGAAC